MDPFGCIILGDEKLPKEIQDEINNKWTPMWEAANAIGDKWSMNYAHEQAQALRDAYANSNSKSEGGLWSSVEYYAGKTASGAKSGFNELVNSYGLGDAGKQVGMSFADGYKKAVKGGLITAGKAGKHAAKRMIPAAGVFFTAQDAGTFLRGFRKGWNAYER